MPRDRAPIELLDERPNALEARSINAAPQVDTTAAVFEPEPPWLSPDNQPIEWEAFERFPNYLAAQIVAGVLENEGVPAIVTHWSVFPGLVSAIIYVPKYLLHRARWVLALAPPSDVELLFLATGELSSDADEAG